MYSYSMEDQLRKEFWEEFEEDNLEIEQDAILNELDKVYNKKGFTLNEYIDYIED